MDLKFDFFKIESSGFEIKPGKLLISEPFLGDTYFKRSIVFLTEHNKNGSVGFILNKPVNIKVSELISDFPDCDFRVSLGGPVGTNTIHYLHTLGDKVPKSVHVYRNIFWGGDFEKIKELIHGNQISREQLRMFVGYSGWMHKQLENEIAENSWIVAGAEPFVVMTYYDRGVWQKVLRGMKEKKYRMWADFPENPGSN